MGIFYERREETENGKRYLVLRSKPLSFVIFLSYFLLVSLSLMGIKILEINASFMSIELILLLVAPLFVCIIMIPLETRGANMAGFRNQSFIKKGANNISFKNPAEVWVEKRE